jgi:hypothetical protein
VSLRRRAGAVRATRVPTGWREPWMTADRRSIDTRATLGASTDRHEVRSSRSPGKD